MELDGQLGAMLNRAAVLLRYKAPAVAWIKCVTQAVTNKVEAEQCHRQKDRWKN